MLLQIDFVDVDTVNITHWLLKGTNVHLLRVLYIGFNKHVVHGNFSFP